MSIALARLVVKRSIRESGVNHEHVRWLMRLGGRWPPILVHEETGVVIDGAHRVAAARMLGLLRIDTSRFSGGPDAAPIARAHRGGRRDLRAVDVACAVQLPPESAAKVRRRGEAWLEFANALEARTDTSA